MDAVGDVCGDLHREVCLLSIGQRRNERFMNQHIRILSVIYHKPAWFAVTQKNE